MGRGAEAGRRWRHARTRGGGRQGATLEPPTCSQKLAIGQELFGTTGAAKSPSVPAGGRPRREGQVL